MRHNAAMLAFALADAATVHEYAADSLYRHNVTAWTDAHIPRTEKPVRFGLSADYAANVWRGFTFRQSAR